MTMEWPSWSLDHVPVVPPGVECIEALDSLSSFPAFVEAVSVLRPRLEASLAAMRPRFGLLVADALLYWEHASADELGIPTVAFFETSIFARVIRDVILRDNPAAVLLADGAAPGTFAVPEFPHIQLTLADIPIPFNDPSPVGPIVEMDAKLAKAIAGSRGLIVNTFDAMEGQYIEHWDRHHIGHRAWPIGPLCLNRPPCHGAGAGAIKPSWMQWLREIAAGLEASGVDVLWAVRPRDADLGDGFEERVEGRGMVVREWVDQWRILRHDCVKGFLSHCGWNAVVEGVAAGVPLATWQMGVEQLLHAMLAVDELRIGVRVPATMGHGVVRSEEIARVARELMAVAEGGSSWKTLEEMVGAVCLPADPRK